MTIQNIIDSRNAIEKLAAQVPGLKGYMEMNARRESDAALRRVISQRTESEISRISALQADWVAQGQYGILDDAERVVTRLRTFADGVRSATQGYSGVFDVVKIGAVQLDQIYQHDLGLLTALDSLSSAVSSLSSGNDLPTGLKFVMEQAGQLLNAFEARKNLFLSLS